MHIAKLIVKEILHRKTHFLLGLVAVAAAVALVVAFVTTAAAGNRETARLMLKTGFNLRIIPADADMNRFLINGFSDRTMPAGYLDTMARQEGFSYNHLLASLQQKIAWRGMEVILTGLAPEVCPPDRKKPPMVFEVKRGTAYMGSVLAEALDIKKGDAIDVNGTMLEIVQCLSPSGTLDDIRIQCHIADAQTILNLPGRINEIQAVDCLCFVPTDDPLAILKDELARVLPEAQVIQIARIAEARNQQRRMVQSYLAFIMAAVIVVAGAWIGLLAMLNVRQRQSEIGIMRAIGYRADYIAALLLGKAVLMGLVGALIGFTVGSALAVVFGPDIFKVTAKALKTDYALLLWSLIAAPAFAAVASFIPVMRAVAQDPADTLRKE
ncbi:MAG: FtsX-like permease family protein [Phycisphaerae bacterium]|nr:FtsX-like permease family protein [Phycisphaerae bacterium]